MGGVAGHLSHLYDNRGITANKVKKILSLASTGELVGTEKTDGYNIYLGFRDGEARYARNKGDMKAGGRKMSDLMARIFAGGDAVKNVYISAFTAFSEFVNRLPEDRKAGIFGENGEIFYNTEIQGPGADQVVNYDNQTLSIHHGGHKAYDPITDSVDVVDAEANSKMLDQALDSALQDASGQDFTISRTAALQLKRLSDDTAVRIAVAKLDRAGFTGNMTMDQYLESKIKPIVENKFSYFAPEIIQLMVDRMLDRKNEDGSTIKLTQIYKGFPANQKEEIRVAVKEQAPMWIKQAVFPIEDAIHDFAVEMLSGLESAYILDNHKQVADLKAQVREAIKNIQAYDGPGAAEAKDVLMTQMSKIKNLDNIDTVVEGFVFIHDGMMYKFTGNFAPVNQILGLFKYGRGNVPAIAKSLSEAPGEVPVVQEGEGTERTVAVVPGAFKPPHKGHLEMVKHYSNKADEVFVFISKLPRGGASKGEAEVNFEESKAIWNLYVEAAGLSNVTVMQKPSENASPMGAAIEFAQNEDNDPNMAQVGDEIIFSASDKLDARGQPDYERFDAVAKYVRDGATMADTKSNAAAVFGDYSATTFRQALFQRDVETMKRYLPDELVKSGMTSDVLEILNLAAEEVPLREVIFRLVEEVLDEKKSKVSKAGQERVSKKIGHLIGDEGKSKEQAAAIAYSMEERGELSEEELEEISLGGGSIQGYSGKKEREERIVNEVLNYLIKATPA